jgi:glycosyltransferase involved in cell wall biosynthesis
MRLPFIQMLHGDWVPSQPADSLLKKYWVIYKSNEYFAVRWCKKFLCVNPYVTDRMRTQYPQYRDKIDTLTTWANTDIFKPQPFRPADDVFRVIFCGRLDQFKMPPLMFASIDRLRQRLGGGVEFHYVGSSNPDRFAEFDLIRDITINHGNQNAAGIADILKTIDVGILTSEFEGMPRFVLETLCAGRPVVAIHLPQLEPVIEDGVSGYLVPRNNNRSAQVEAVTDCLIEVRSAIGRGSIDPNTVNRKMAAFNPERLLGKVYEYHRELQSRHPAAPDFGYRLCLIHPMDPRGNKIGGIETHLRLLLKYAPQDCEIVFVGVDGRGDRKLGEISIERMNGRKYKFLPVIYFPDEKTHAASKTISGSITARFAVGLIWFFNRIRREISPYAVSVELQRFEFALYARLFRKPVIQIIHGEGSKLDKMDSLIKKYWFLHRLNEEIAIRLADVIVGVNQTIKKRVQLKLPHAKNEILFMPVSVDTEVFQPRKFDNSDGIFRVVFSGRLDEFKDPPTMFLTLRELHQRFAGALEFHYIGTSDPSRYPEFKLIKSFTILHGYQQFSDVSAITARCHAGILTSYFEGMPCYLLETLSVGRPVVAIRLPQYESIIEEGVSGYLVNRGESNSALIINLADRFVALWAAISEGRMNVDLVHGKIKRFSAENQLVEHFAKHRDLAKGVYHPR